MSGIGDLVWNDLNRNGIQDTGELGVEGVKVELYNCGGSLAATLFTDVNGIYLFTVLVPGSYSLKFYPPAGWKITIQDVQEAHLKLNQIYSQMEQLYAQFWILVNWIKDGMLVLY